MMALFTRLRRSVALFLCPEQALEARIKTAIGDAIKGYAPRAHVAISQNEKTGFFDLCGGDAAMAELFAHLRHRRIERAKEVLKIIQSVQLDGLPSDDDPAFDALAQRFAVLLFGQK